LARLIVKEILETKGAIVLEDLPKRAPVHMIKNIREQLRFEDLPRSKTVCRNTRCYVRLSSTY